MGLNRSAQPYVYHTGQGLEDPHWTDPLARKAHPTLVPLPRCKTRAAFAGSEQCIVGLVVWWGRTGGRGHSTIFHRSLVGLAPRPNGAAAIGPLGTGSGWRRSRAGLGALYPLESLLWPRPGAALGPGRGLVGRGHCPPPSVGRMGGEC